MSRLTEGLIVIIVVLLAVHFLWGAFAPLLYLALALLVILLVLRAIF